jgi:hypothetical protein
VNDLFLGIIAGAVTVMAIVQVAAIVFAARAARSVGEAVSRLERDVQPIVANLQTMSADAARATTAVTAQVERLQKTMDVVLDRVDTASARVEQTLQTIQDGILAPAREGLGILQMIKSFFAAGRPSRSGPGHRPAPADDEDALFIG